MMNLAINTLLNPQRHTQRLNLVLLKPNSSNFSHLVEAQKAVFSTTPAAAPPAAAVAQVYIPISLPATSSQMAQTRSKNTKSRKQNNKSTLGR